MYAYIAIPIEMLQQYNDQGIQSLTLAQDVSLKTLPDGNINQQIQEHEVLKNVILMPIINSDNQLYNGSSEKLGQLVMETINEPNSNDMGKGAIRKSVILKSSSSNLNRKEVRYLKCKASQNKKVSVTKTKEGFKCTICGVVFDKMMLYRKHMEMHTNVKKYKCEQCTASYNKKENLTIHMAMHNKSQPTCPVCDRKFQRLASLKAHIIVHEVDEAFTCPECLSEFEREADFNKHMDVHKKDKQSAKSDNSPKVCSICSQVFNDTNLYKEHITYHAKIKKMMLNSKKQKRRINTNKEYPHKCEVCGKSFVKFFLLERHMRIHSGEKPFVCHICKHAFAQKGTLQIHLVHHSGIKPYSCTLCAAKFSQKGNLRVHVQKTHIVPSPGSTVYKCTMCTCVFKTVSSLNTHITRVHTTEKECDDISVILQQLKQLERSLPKIRSLEEPDKAVPVLPVDEDPNEVDENVELGMDVKYVKVVDCSIEGNIRRYLVKQRKAGECQWYVCSYCGKEFKKPSDLIRHIRVHTGEKPFKCKQCGQTFSLKSTLKTHMETHGANRQYKCTTCLKSFTSLKSLNFHNRQHAKNYTKRLGLYACDFCDVISNSASKAKSHAESHKAAVTNTNINDFTRAFVLQQPMVETEEGLLPLEQFKSRSQVATPKARPHQCPICKSAFIKSVHLKRHMLTHTGERKFQCDVCSKSFYSSYSLKEHLQFHSNEKNFSCKICNKRFVTKGILRRHLSIHSTLRPYVCPYCKKHFKTVLLCRKHIRTHKKFINIEDAGQIAMVDGEDASAIIDNSLSVCSFSFPILNGDVNVKSDGEEVLKFTSKSKEINQDYSSSSKILFTNSENGIIISTPLDFQLKEEVKETHASLGQSLYEIGNLSLLTDTTDKNISNIGDLSDLEQKNTNFHAVFINSEDMQSLSDTNLCSTGFPQLKNMDPLMMSNVNQITDPSIVFTADTSFNQLNDLQLDTHNLETLLPTFTFGDKLTLNNVPLNSNFPNIILSNVDDTIDVDQLPMFGNANDVNKKVQVQLVPEDLPIQSDIMDINDDPLAEAASNLLYNTNQETEIAVNATVDRSKSGMDSVVCLNSTVEFACTYCKQVLKSTSDFKNHKCIRKTNKNVIKRKAIAFEDNSEKEEKASEGTLNNSSAFPYKCSRCNESVASKAALTRHTLTHKEKKVVTNNVCSYCAKAFKKCSDLTRHIRTHTGEKPYHCDKCDKSFSLKSTLESHYKTHFPANNKYFNCAVCNSNFSSKSSLKVHILIHTGIKPYQCSICPEKFRTSGLRKNHMKNHFKKAKQIEEAHLSLLDGTQNVMEIQQASQLLLQESQKDDLFSSNIIQDDQILLQQLQLNNVLLQNNMDSEVTSFIQVNIDGDNVKSSNGNVKKDNSISRKFECDVCLKKYSTKSVLTKHKKIHAMKNLFNCMKCDDKFSSEGDLGNHVKVHSGYRPFCCQLCANTFSQEKNLKTHMKRIHGTNSFEIAKRAILTL